MQTSAHRRRIRVPRASGTRSPTSKRNPHSIRCPHHEVITRITYRSNADQQRNSQWFNYRVNAATATFEAINVLATRFFDLVLMNCEIPASPHESRLIRDWTRPPSVDCARNQPIVGQESGP